MQPKIPFINRSRAMLVRPTKKVPSTLMSNRRVSPVVSEVEEGHARPTASLASTIVTWTAIIFVSPLALYALFFFIPGTVELLDRILHHPMRSRGPLTVMVLTEVALLTLTAMTFISWRRGHQIAKPPHRTLMTILLGCATIAVGLFAYLLIAMMVAAFPD